MEGIAFDLCAPIGGRRIFAVWLDTLSFGFLVAIRSHRVSRALCMIGFITLIPSCHCLKSHVFSINYQENSYVLANR